MREFIDMVCEGLITPRMFLPQIVPAGLKSVVPIDELQAAYDMLKAGHHLDGVNRHAPRSSRDALDDLKVALRKLERECDSGFFRVHRAITVSHIDLSQPTHVGLHWTYNPNFTMGGLAFDDDEGGAMRVVEMEGAVGLEGIDWAETLCLACDGVEDEIRLKPGARIERFTANIEGEVSSVQFA